MTFLCFSKTKTKKCNTKYNVYGYQLDIFVNIVIILFLDSMFFLTVRCLLKENADVLFG